MSIGDLNMKDKVAFSIENDFCPVAYALKIIGGKWKLPILWYSLKMAHLDIMN